MPTWRGTVDKVGVSKNDAYLMYYLCELDKRLTDDEIFYINIHPMAVHAKNTAEVSKLKHIRTSPQSMRHTTSLTLQTFLLQTTQAYSSIMPAHAKKWCFSRMIKTNISATEVCTWIWTTCHSLRYLTLTLL